MFQSYRYLLMIILFPVKI